jgi:protein SCO1/2
VRQLCAAVLAAILVATAACGDRPAAPVTGTTAGAATASTTPAKRYMVVGQVLVVSEDKKTLSIKHNDIAGYMPAMTMTFPVATADLMKGRVPGELITAVLQVDSSAGQLVEITNTGHAPLPDKSNASSLAAGVLEPGQEAPDSALIDQNDKRRSFAEWKGQPTLLTFIYTRCPLPNFCPLMDRNFTTIARAAGADPALNGKFKLVSVSFDPDFDTPAVLNAHAAKLKADTNVWTFLTADRVTIERFAAKFGVGVVRDGAAADDITHNLRTVLIGADRKIIKIYPGGDWSTTTVLNDLRAAVTQTAAK